MLNRIITTMIITFDIALTYLTYVYYHIPAIGIVLIGNALFIMISCWEIQDLKNKLN